MNSRYELVIRGGLLADGTEATPRVSDVAVSGRRIVAAGSFAGRDREEIGATNRLVRSGFVDVHTHYCGQATWECRLSSFSGHGVTSAVMGNCGVGFAPVRDGHQDTLLKVMEGVEDIPEVVMAADIPWGWRTFPEDQDVLAARSFDIDIAAQLPHSPLRVYG